MQRKVLIVDDESGIIDVVAGFIERSSLNLQIISANSVDEAIGLVDSDSPDVIISDVMMPKKTGLELLKELSTRGKRIPVIMISGFGNKDVIRKAWQLGAFDFLDKPINSKRLIENLEIALEMGQENSFPRASALQVKVFLEPKVFNKAQQLAKTSNLSIDVWAKELIVKATGT